jgi:hypothetical protein
MRVLRAVFLTASLALATAGVGLGAGSAGADVPSGIEHAPWARLLAEFVDEKGRVAYARLSTSANDRQSLRVYLGQLAQTGKTPAAGPERLASLINAYNALTISWILENYPVRSIRSTRNPFGGRRWDIGGKQVSLDDIEHTMLRPTAGFRVHAAISCASRSCPPLSREAYTAGTLDAALDVAMRRWLARGDLNRFLPGRREVEVSKVFRWFKEDFEHAGGLRAVLARFAPQEYAEFLSKGDYDVDYLDYDWSLNDQAGEEKR